MKKTVLIVSAIVILCAVVFLAVGSAVRKNEISDVTSLSPAQMVEDAIRSKAPEDSSSQTGDSSEQSEPVSDGTSNTASSQSEYTQSFETSQSVTSQSESSRAESSRNNTTSDNTDKSNSQTNESESSPPFSFDIGNMRTVEGTITQGSEKLPFNSVISSGMIYTELNDTDDSLEIGYDELLRFAGLGGNYGMYYQTVNSESIPEYVVQFTKNTPESKITVSSVSSITVSDIRVSSATLINVVCSVGEMKSINASVLSKASTGKLVPPDEAEPVAYNASVMSFASSVEASLTDYSDSYGVSAEIVISDNSIVWFGLKINAEDKSEKLQVGIAAVTNGTTTKLDVDVKKDGDSKLLLKTVTVPQGIDKYKTDINAEIGSKLHLLMTVDNRVDGKKTYSNGTGVLTMNTESGDFDLDIDYNAVLTTSSIGQSNTDFTIDITAYGILKFTVSGTAKVFHTEDTSAYLPKSTYKRNSDRYAEVMTGISEDCPIIYTTGDTVLGYLLS